jgi:hypothetical protein
MAAVSRPYAVPGGGLPSGRYSFFAPGCRAASAAMATRLGGIWWAFPLAGFSWNFPGSKPI